MEMLKKPMRRRQFVKTIMAAGASFPFLTSPLLAQNKTVIKKPIPSLPPIILGY